MRKKLLTALLFAAITAGAVKMKPGLTTVRQADGTTITVRAYGDEDLSYFVATDGTLLYQEGTAFYIAKVNADGSLGSTGILAHEPGKRSLQEANAVLTQNATAFYTNMTATAAANKARREPMYADNTLLPSLGKQKVCVILVEFSDVPFSISNPKETFDKYLNGKELFSKTDDPEMGSNYGSVARYFNDMSFGKFQPEFDVYGPVTLSKPLATYGAGSSAQENMGLLLSDACTAVDSEVDFTKYDANDDGNIDLVYIIYAGYSQSIAGNSTDCIHPKSGTLSVAKSFDGMSIKRYGVNNELNGTPDDQKNGPLINGIGLFCHEFSHCMGLPDLYPASGTTAVQCINQNMDYWSLMDAGEYTNNGYRPTAYTAWERERLGWMKIDTLSTAANVELQPVADGGKAYRILNDKDETGHEYYIVENVQKTGWNKSLFGSGLMVTHVDYLANQFSLGGCKVNNTAGHPRMTVVPADGMFVPEYYIGRTIEESPFAVVKEANVDLLAKYGGQTFSAQMYIDEAAGDLFPGKANTTSLTDDSAPVKAWMYNGETLGKPITDITNDEEKGIVTFKFMGGAVDGIKDVAADSANQKSIFSTSGVYMGTDFSALPKGIYLMNGKKMVKE